MVEKGKCKDDLFFVLPVSTTMALGLSTDKETEGGKIHIIIIMRVTDMD